MGAINLEAQRGDLIVLQVINGVMAGVVTRVSPYNGLAIGMRPFGSRKSISLDSTAPRLLVPAADINVAACREIAKARENYFESFAEAREAFRPHLR